jgi:hypothetical protein
MSFTPATSAVGPAATASLGASLGKHVDALAPSKLSLGALEVSTGRLKIFVGERLTTTVCQSRCQVCQSRCKVCQSRCSARLGSLNSLALQALRTR